MDRCLIVLDFDAKRLRASYQGEDWQNAYRDVEQVLNRHGFNIIQGAVYLSDVGICQAHATIALQEAAARYEWFALSVTSAKFYGLVNEIDAQFVVDGVTQARQAFKSRIDDLREHLLLAGLDAAKIGEITANLS